MPDIEVAIGPPSWDWSASVEGLVGALIGGLFALIATMLAAHFSERQAKRQRRAVVVGGVKALWAEMQVNFSRYEEELAGQIRALTPNEYLAVNWPLKSDYFAVYAANAGLLGELSDDALAFQIVQTVTAAKGLVDSLRLNLEMMEALAPLLARARAGERGADLDLLIQERETQLINYGQTLKGIDPILTGGMTRLTPRIAALK